MKTAIAILLCLTGISSQAQDEPAKEEAPLPSRVQVLVDAYEREKERVLAPVELKYEQALRDLKSQLTKAGRLDGALAVDKILDSRNPEPESETNPVRKDTRWAWGSGGVLVLRANGRCTHTKWTKEGRWKLQKDGTIDLENETGGHVITFLENGNAVVRGKRGSGSGTTLTPIEEEE